MREIKFRAWDFFFEEMYYFDFKNNIDVRNGTLWINHKEGAISCQSPSVKIMQYTGLKDKNGREIYEGDILKYTNFKGKEEILQVWWEDEIAGFNFGNRNLSFIKYHIAVIGNIYENLELLEVE